MDTDLHSELYIKDTNMLRNSETQDKPHIAWKKVLRVVDFLAAFYLYCLIVDWKRLSNGVIGILFSIWTVIWMAECLYIVRGVVSRVKALLTSWSRTLLAESSDTDNTDETETQEILVEQLEPSSEERVYTSKWFGIQFLVPPDAIAETRRLKVTVSPAFESIGTEVIKADGSPCLIWSPMLSGCGDVVLHEGKMLQLRFSVCPCPECTENPPAIFRTGATENSDWTEVEGACFDPAAETVTVGISGFSRYALALRVANRSGISQHRYSEAFKGACKEFDGVRFVVNGYKLEAGVNNEFAVISLPEMATSAVSEDENRSNTFKPELTAHSGQAGATLRVGERNHTTGTHIEFHQQLNMTRYGQQVAHPMNSLTVRNRFWFGSSTRWEPNPLTIFGEGKVKVFVATQNDDGYDLWWHDFVPPSWGVLIMPPKPARPIVFPADLRALQCKPGTATLDSDDASRDAQAERHQITE
eukprot:TRINITY_DN3097_c0_g1_i2.p1 TRINITY_DN3097_c0_g1~~TRINITY_DN3097_c0_g1_i2.p1  ORF type:complete len:472 (-),score=15.23 TRINITY_DN3097_c0_g1_i2:80-1495(-)